MVSENIAIKVSNLSKIYPLYNSPNDRLKEALHPRRRKYHTEFYALRDINLQIEKGEAVGIIGQNGSGKSTLLKILSTVLTPSTGNYEVKGKVSSLLELGTGFNPELSGIENVYFNGTLLGFTREQMDEKLDDILSFADIGEFVNQPVKNYSTGMYVRLAFAVAVQVDPDILIIDEALAVGDTRFQQKCFRRMKSFREKNKSIILVTHDTSSIINFCDRAVWLKKGEIFQDGKPEEIVKKYIGYMNYDLETKEISQEASPDNNLAHDIYDADSKNNTLNWESVTGCSFFGEGGALIKAIAISINDAPAASYIFNGGEKISFYIRVKINEYIEKPGIGILLKDRLGNSIFSVNNYIYDRKLNPMQPGEELITKTVFNMPHIANGIYTFTIAISDGDQFNHIQHQWIHDVKEIQVENNQLKYKLGNMVVLEDESYDICIINK